MLGHVGRSVLPHVAGDHAREGLVAHVDQVHYRDRTHHGAEQLGALRDRGPGRQPAVGGADEAQPPRRCQAGSDRVLGDGEVRQLVALAREIPSKVPSLRDAQGKQLPADVEFAFLDGKLAQIGRASCRERV